MRKIPVFLLLVLCMCFLTACGAETPPITETTIPELTNAIPETAEPAPSETAPVEVENVKDLLIAEEYYFIAYEEDIPYQRYLTLYPNSRFYSAGWAGDSSCGTYVLDEEGRIVMEIGGELCVFKKTDHTLVLESGSFAIFSDSGSINAEPGKVSRDRYTSLLKDGIYELNLSGSDYTFVKVLLDIDLTKMAFTLKCFDGSVVTGSLSFEENLLICTHEGGTMRLRVTNPPGTVSLEKTRGSAEKGAVSTDQLMFYPPADGVMNYSFRYAKDQAQEIVSDPKVVPLDSYKHLFRRIYQFRCPETEGSNGLRCVFNIYHYPLEGKWAFEGATMRTDVAVEENPGGSIVFSLNGKLWNFHRDGQYLCYDGGSPLIAGIWNVDTEKMLEAAVPEGAMFHVYEENHVYDALYILPNGSLDTAYASIQLDTKNQLLKIHCYDGTVLEGAYTYEEDYTRFPVEVMGLWGPETANVALFPQEHALSVRNEGVRDQWKLLIGPGEISDTFDFLPITGIQPCENSTD